MDQATFRKLKFLFEPVETPEDFDTWLRYWLDVEFPWDTVDPDSTSSPLKNLWSVYRAMLYGENPNMHVVAAARNSMKTLNSSAIHFFSLLQFRRDTAHIAATLNQSAAAGSYLNKFILRNGSILQSYISVANFRKTEFINLPQTDFTDKTDAKIQIVTATKKGANAPRASCLVFDEVDLTDQTILDEAAFVADPTRDRHRFNPVFVYLSSRKTNSGPIQSLIDKAEQPGQTKVKLHKWSAVDMMKTCTPEIRGSEEYTGKAYVNTDDLRVIFGEEQFLASVPPTSQALWKETAVFSNCITCPAFVACQGHSARQRGESPSLRSREFIGDMVSAVKNSSAIISQWLNWQPDPGGIVFRSFSRHKHLLDPFDFYEYITGQTYNPTDGTQEEFDELVDNATIDELMRLSPNKEQLYAAMIQSGWDVTFGVDWGFDPDPANCIVIGYHRKLGKACVLHYEQANRYADHVWAAEVERKIAPLYPPSIICPDMANKSSPTFFKNHTVWSESKEKIEVGVSFIRGLLWNPIRQSADFAVLDDSLWVGEEGNLIAVGSFEHWSHLKKPNGEFDYDRFEDDDYTHPLDALRYALAPYVKNKTGSISSTQPGQQRVYYGMSQEEIDAIKARQKYDQHLREHILETTGVDLKEKTGDKQKPKSGSLKFKF